MPRERDREREMRVLLLILFSDIAGLNQSAVLGAEAADRGSGRGAAGRGAAGAADPLHAGTGADEPAGGSQRRV